MHIAQPVKKAGLYSNRESGPSVPIIQQITALLGQRVGPGVCPTSWDIWSFVLGSPATSPGHRKLTGPHLKSDLLMDNCMDQ
jgi:hypothetical protein